MDYSINFQDNIPSFNFNSTTENVLRWIEENRDKFDWAKDPNAYEMVNLFLFSGKYAQEGKEVNLEALSKMWHIRSQDFEGCNIGPNHFVYALCNDAYQSAVSEKSMVNDENSHHALRKMAGIGLYLKQQQRDNGSISYNNPQELLTLLRCSKTLQTFHPDLFEKYAFEKNLDVLCNLQLSQDLPPEISDAIETAKQQLSKSLEDTALENQSPNVPNTDART